MKKTKKLVLAIILLIGMIIFSPNVFAEEVPTSIKDIDIYYGRNEEGDFSRITFTINDDMDLRYSYIELYDKTIQDMPTTTYWEFKVVENEKPTTYEDYTEGKDFSYDDILPKGTKLYLYKKAKLFQAEKIDFTIYWKNKEGKYYQETIDYRVEDGGTQYVNSVNLKDVTEQTIQVEKFYELLEKNYPFLGTWGDSNKESEFYTNEGEMWIVYEIDEKPIKVTLVKFDGTPAEKLIAQIDASLNKGTTPINESGKISASALEDIKSSKITTTYEKKNEDEKLLYSWSFDGSKMTNEDTKLNINLEIAIIETPNKDKIDALVPASIASLKIDFKHSGTLPTGTSVKLNVADSFNNDDVLDLYYYNPEADTLEKVTENIVVIDGYASFPLAHCSEYVLVVNNEAKEDYLDNNVQTSSMNVILYAIISVVSLLALGYIIKNKNKEIA